jgi:hypothetical protein
MKPMAESPSRSMVLVYDLRRDRGQRERMLSQVLEQWEAYERGEWPVHISEGRIRRLFVNPHGGEHMFELDEGARLSTWVRQGDDTWYTVGWHARVEQVVFHMPPPVGAVPVVTRIWIGNAG